MHISPDGSIVTGSVITNRPRPIIRNTFARTGMQSIHISVDFSMRSDAAMICSAFGVPRWKLTSNWGNYRELERAHNMVKRLKTIKK